jgi:hypothetical protein
VKPVAGLDCFDEVMMDWDGDEMAVHRGDAMDCDYEVMMVICELNCRFGLLAMVIHGG